MDTLDFEVEIGPGTEQTYPVTARALGSGEAATSMRLLLASEELDHQLAVITDAVLASSAVVRRIATREEQPVQQLGRLLFEGLLAGDVRALFGASSQRARQEGRRLRLVLRIHPPELARLPWEFLFDPNRQDYLGLSMPLVRYPQVLAPQQPLQVAPPLQVLGMVARPGDRDVLQVDEEQQRLRTALGGLEGDGLVQLSWVAGQTYRDLEDAMDQGPWHMLHFIGHGGFDQATGEGTIALVSGDGHTDLVGAEDLSRLLGDHYPLRLVVLNACDTGRASTLDSFSSTAGALVRRGIPAVVAMQFEITDPAAIQFARVFYENMAKGLAVDISIMRARRGLRRAKKDTLEWGTPVLYLRSPDGRIFDPTATPPPSSPRSKFGQLQDPAEPDTLEALYDEALAAYWTERWDQAVELLQQVVAHRRDDADAADKLKQARRQQQLIIRYTQACAAADAQNWEQAITAFALVLDADPAYRDARERLEQARRQQQLAGLQAEARRLHRAKQWAAVVKIGERLQTLDTAAADPDGLVSQARAELATAEYEQLLASHYRTGLRHLEASAWRQALEAFRTVEHLDPTYRDIQELVARARQELAGRGLQRIASDPRTLQTLRHRSRVNAVAYSPDGRWLATAIDVGRGGIWDTSNGQQRLTVAHQETWKKGSGVWVRGVAFSPDGRWLATASGDKTARIWDASNGQEHLKVTHNGVVNQSLFSPDGRWLATASNDKTARIWDASNGQEHLKVTHNGAVRGVAFSPDGRWLATASDDKTAQVWVLEEDSDDGPA